MAAAGVVVMVALAFPLFSDSLCPTAHGVLFHVTYLVNSVDILKLLSRYNSPTRRPGKHQCKSYSSVLLCGYTYLHGTQSTLHLYL